MTRAKKPVLWVYEKQKPTRRSTPTESGHQRDFYAFQDKDGTKNFEVENLLSQLEGVVAPLVQNAEPSEILRRKAIFAVFVALTQQRVPAARKYTRQVMRQMVEAFRNESPSASVWREFLRQAAQIQGIGPFDDQFFEWIGSDEGQGELTAPQVLQLTIGSVFRYAEVLFEAGWELSPSPVQPLVTSDNPAYTMKPGDPVRFGFGVKVPGVEMLFPVRRNLLLRISRALTQDGIREIPPTAARNVNKMTMQCATRFLFASEDSEKIRRLFDELGCAGRCPVRS